MCIQDTGLSPSKSKLLWVEGQPIGMLGSGTLANGEEGDIIQMIKSGLIIPTPFSLNPQYPHGSWSLWCTR